MTKLQHPSLDFGLIRQISLKRWLCGHLLWPRCEITSMTENRSWSFTDRYDAATPISTGREMNNRGIIHCYSPATLVGTEKFQGNSRIQMKLWMYWHQQWVSFCGTSRHNFLGPDLTFFCNSYWTRVCIRSTVTIMQRSTAMVDGIVVRTNWGKLCMRLVCAWHFILNPFPLINRISKRMTKLTEGEVFRQLALCSLYPPAGSQSFNHIHVSVSNLSVSLCNLLVALYFHQN